MISVFIQILMWQPEIHQVNVIILYFVFGRQYVIRFYVAMYIPYVMQSFQSADLHQVIKCHVRKLPTGTWLPCRFGNLVCLRCFPWGFACFRPKCPWLRRLNHRTRWCHGSTETLLSPSIIPLSPSQSQTTSAFHTIPMLIPDPIVTILAA